LRAILTSFASRGDASWRMKKATGTNKRTPERAGTQTAPPPAGVWYKTKIKIGAENIGGKKKTPAVPTRRPEDDL
jgi:hypothetical protein